MFKMFAALCAMLAMRAAALSPGTGARAATPTPNAVSLANACAKRTDARSRR